MISFLNMGLQRNLNRNLNQATDRIGQALQRLSSGSTLNSPKDGAVAYARVQDLKSQARGLGQALRNVSDASGLTKQAESSLSSMLQDVFDLRQIAERAANGNISTEERTELTTEASRILSQLNEYSTSTTYNSFSLLNGSLGTVSVQDGISSSSQFSFSIGDARTTVLGRLAILSGSQTGGTTESFNSTNSLVLNGVTIAGSLDDGVSSSGADGSSLAKVTAINSYTNQTGVYAETLGTIRSLVFSSAGSTFTGTLASGDFVINGTNITGAVTTTSSLINVINAATSSTGVIASVDASGYVQLAASDGRNIQIEISNSSGNAFWDAVNMSTNQSILFTWSTVSSGSLNNTNVGAVRLYSSKQITVLAGNPETVGIASGVYNLTSGTAVTSIDLSSVDNANQAIKVLNATVTQISALRANVGSVHDRLDSSSTKLVRDQENALSTAEAIEAPDVALETVRLVYNQLLQNSSLASLMQANISAVTVSKLLGNL